MIRIICFFISLLTSLFGTLGVDSSPAYDPNVYAAGLPSYYEVGEVRVELLSDSLVRIETKGPKGFENRPSFTVQNRENWKDVDFTVSERNGTVVIRSAKYSVHLPNDAKNAEGSYITSANGDLLWQFETETDANVFLPSPSDELNAWYFCDSPRVIPSANGYAPGRLTEKNNGWDLSNQAQDVFVFLPQGSYETFTRDFVTLTGRSEMLPLQMLGFWDSRYYEYTSKTALAQINDYLDRGYPIDMLVIDTDWRMSGGGTGYSVNLKDFPFMSNFLKKAHELGVGVIFNDHPEPTARTTNLLDASEVYFRNYNLKNLLKKGLDYWWYDRNWWTGLKPIDEDLSIYTSGMYAYYEITKNYYESAAKKGEYARRPAIMANVDGIGNGKLEYPSELAAHRYSLQWTGDIGTTSADLADEIFNTVYGGVGMGLPYISSDLGGHTSEVTPDMYIRWIQYGALSPIMRVHCTKPYSRMPWLYGDQADEVTHTYVDMRYRLLPLFYSLAHENYTTGLPIVRRLDVTYPQYRESSANDEYLLGSNILVAPLADSFPQATDYSFSCDGQPGLKAEYFANETLSGTPEIVRQEASPYHDWIFSAPEGLSVSDYFSVRWSGKLRVGDKPVFIRVMADDGIRIWLDGKQIVDGWDVFNVSFTTDFIPANSEHDIRIEYFDGNNHAHLYFYLLAQGEVSRDVFLPDGAWMDVWTGTCYTGPAAVSVTHDLNTSPIFVRMGSVNILADNMRNTSAGDWSHLTLDVYPSENAADTQILYEDDCETVAYKDGQYRETAVSLQGNGKNQTVTVFPAKGRFSGKRAFGERTYTLRIHRRSGWGELAAVTVNGKPTAFSVIGQDCSGAPFANLGGSRDGVVYEVAFRAAVSEQTVVSASFSASAPELPSDRPEVGRASISLSVRKLEKENASFTIPADAMDWMLYGINTNYAAERKAGAAPEAIGPMLSEGAPVLFDDNYQIGWMDGTSIPGGSTTCGLVAYRRFSSVLSPTDGAHRYRLYLGGYCSLASLTLRDESGFAKTVTFGDTDTNYYRVVDIETAGSGRIFLDYSLLSGNNITVAAIVEQPTA